MVNSVDGDLVAYHRICAAVGSGHCSAMLWESAHTPLSKWPNSARMLAGSGEWKSWSESGVRVMPSRIGETDGETGRLSRGGERVVTGGEMAFSTGKHEGGALLTPTPAGLAPVGLGLASAGRAPARARLLSVLPPP